MIRKSSYILSVCLVALLTACGGDSDKKNLTETEKPIKAEKPVTTEPKASKQKPDKEEAGLRVISGETKDLLSSYYELPHIKYWYEEEMRYASGQAPDLTFPDDLSTLSYEQLRLLRNEVFARNGYLFNDGFLRGYFNKKKWYRPVFDVDSFRIVLNESERKLVNALIAEEKKRKEKRLVEREGIELYNADLIANKAQFKSVHKTIQADLSQNNFSLVDANRSMPFYIYDKNAYNYIPHYITTDLYLFILHKYFGKFLEKLDENYLSRHLASMVDQTMAGLSSVEYPGQETNQALDWARAYLAITRFALTGEKQPVPEAWKEVYDLETEGIAALSGRTTFIPNETISYAELSPRGHYTSSEEMKRYFRAFKWISLNGVDIDNQEQLKGMITLAYLIKTSPEAKASYEAFSRALSKIAGKEDNVSMADLFPLISEEEALNVILDQSNVSGIANKLRSLRKERIRPVLGPGYSGNEAKTTRVYFLSSTYSVSADIFSRLVHINGNDSKRPFPRALDIPAVFQNQTAERVIREELGDDIKWPGYQDRLAALQTRFESFDEWDHNYGFRGLKTALAATAEEENYPGFMKTDAYNRKELSTMLSSWTHIKHDLILYQEKPWAAEAGQGGGPPAPDHYSYVEPNLVFWKESLALVDWLMDLEAYDTSLKSALLKIKGIGEDLLNAATKQASGEEITMGEYDKLHRIGGRIEYALLDILETDHIPEREKQMGLIADVYSYNGTNLNVAVGSADDIYVVVPIKNEYYIARGATFSFYEFESDQIYTDEMWRARAGKRDLPARPRWIAPLIHDDLLPLEGDVQFRYPGWWMLRDGI